MKITLNYIETYAEHRIPHRIVFSDLNSAILDIEKWIDLMNVSISPWMFKELEQKYTPDGRPTRIGPKYSTAIIDKLFFDIDCYTKKGGFIERAYQSMLTLWDWATEYDYKRDVSFTGGGYQMCIGVKNLNTESYRNVIHHLIKELDLYIDENISLTDMRRYVGSYNYGKKGKSPRNKWCISLKDYEVHKEWFEHLKLANNQRKDINIYGYNYYEAPNVGVVRKKRKLEHRSDFTKEDGLDKILDKYGWIYEDICPSMRSIIEQEHVGHRERIYVIKYLKTIVGMNYADVVVLLPKLLTARHGPINDGQHSLEEGQPYSVYSRNLFFNPKAMRKNGYCDQSCRKCDELIHITLKARKEFGPIGKEVKKTKLPSIWR